MNQYNLELKKVIEKIKSIEAQLVCIQLPDGLKPKAEEIEAEISSKTSVKVLIWLGSCFGSCDLASGLEKMGVDLLVSWGHNARGLGWK